MRRFLRPLLAAALAALSLAGPAAACGTDTDCRVGDRIYRIHVGADLGPRPGALVFAHGYRGSAAGVMKNASLRRMADDLGVALIALQGVEGRWGLAHAPAGRAVTEPEEMAYVEAVLADATGRFGLDPGRIVASGFSAGGMLTWTLACREGALFAGFIPVSGTFWDPVPRDCAGPVRPLVHIHGDDDPVVPQLGRPIGQARQGKVPEALAMYADEGGFGAAERSTAGDMTCLSRTAPEGTPLAFCQFPGGHSFSTDRLRRAWAMIVE